MSGLLGLPLSQLKGTGCKYCVTCYNLVEKVNCFKTHASNILNKQSKTPPQTARFKRSAMYTPTPMKDRPSKKRLYGPDSKPDFEDFGDHNYILARPISEECSVSFKESFDILNQEMTDPFTKFLFETDSVLDALCSQTIEPGPSCLRMKAENLLESDLINRIILEMRNTAPKLLQVLQVLCSPLTHSKENSKTTVAVMYAMGMYCRNRDLNAIQNILTCASMDCHANNRLLQVKILQYFT